MRSNRFWLHTAIVCGISVAQSTLFREAGILGVRPDLALVFLVFSAHQHGSYLGQLSGFASGLVEDTLSLSPLGFHALLKTVVGYLTGLFRGKIFLDAVFVPMILAAAATVIKFIGAFVLKVFFLSGTEAALVFSIDFPIELGMNVISAPFVYGIFKLIGLFKPVRSDL